MKKIKIHFTITSSEANNQFTTDGEFKNNRMKFVDNEENLNYIVFKKDALEYYKRGNIEMKYNFRLGHKTTGEYKTSGVQFSFSILTKRLVVTDNLIEIEYDLYQDDEVVNKTKIHIEYDFCKEDTV